MAPKFGTHLGIGRVETSTLTVTYSTRGKEKLLTRRENIGFATFLDSCLLGMRQPGCILPLFTDTDSLLQSALYTLLELCMFLIELPPTRLFVNCLYFNTSPFTAFGIESVILPHRAATHLQAGSSKRERCEFLLKRVMWR